MEQFLSGLVWDDRHGRVAPPGRKPAVRRQTPDQLLEQLDNAEDLLVVQDLDGVCMQLVKDPLTRRLDHAYVRAAAKLQGSFVVDDRS